MPRPRIAIPLGLGASIVSFAVAFAAAALLFSPARGHRRILAFGDGLIEALPVRRARRSLDGYRGENVIRHPWLIIEILSPSTAEDDLTTKFDAYRTIDELTHDSRRHAIRLDVRDDSGAFRAGQAVRTVDLPRLGTSLDLEAIYDGTTVPSIAISFSPPPDADLFSPIAP